MSAAFADRAYDDRALPIAAGQTISQPFIVAAMAAAAELGPDDHVLEIGTGSGYGAAVLGRIAAQVWTLERYEELATAAARVLAELRADNVHVECDDGTLGAPEHGPFDAIVVTAAGPSVPAALVAQMRDEGARGGRVLLEPSSYSHPGFANARTCTPLLVQTDTRHGALYREERFGPVGFVIECHDADDALSQATRDVKQHGGLTAFVYSRDEAFIERAEQAYAHAGAQLTINLTGPMPLNFAAAYSDYHVTGLNPAGNASLTDLSFVAGRFRIAQSRRPAPPGASA